MTGRRRPTRSILEAQDATCDACPWTSSGPGALGNAAKHYDATQHPVSIRSTRVTRYGNEADRTAALEEAGQTTMLDGVEVCYSEPGDLAGMSRPRLLDGLGPGKPGPHHMSDAFHDAATGGPEEPLS